MIKKIDTGCELIHRFDNVIDIKICDSICEYIVNKKGIYLEGIDKEKMPWNEGDTISYDRIKNKEIKDKIKECKNLISDLISSTFKEKTYPHFSDLVLWREGKKMGWHKDSGYVSGGETFEPRTYTCVAYLNDDYYGGETIIKENKKEYVSIPQKGSIIFFTSDERCEHMVSEVKSGIRITLAMWYTTNINYKEKD